MTIEEMDAKAKAEALDLDNRKDLVDLDAPKTDL